jgi:hypothetical protein
MSDQAVFLFQHPIPNSMNALYLTLAVIGICVVLLFGVFLACVYIEHISAGSESDLEPHYSMLRASQHAHLEYWVRNEIAKLHQTNSLNMNQQRDEIEDYVVDRLREHLHILGMSSPTVKEYGTFPSLRGCSD